MSSAIATAIKDVAAAAAATIGDAAPKVMVRLANGQWKAAERGDCDTSLAAPLALSMETTPKSAPHERVNIDVSATLRDIDDLAAASHILGHRVMHAVLFEELLPDVVVPITHILKRARSSVRAERCAGG